MTLNVKVLVCGATGRQGGAVVNALLAKGGIDVCALTRDKHSRAAKQLVDRGVATFEGDLEKHETLVKALRDSGAQRVFLVTMAGVRASRETGMGNAMVDAIVAVNPAIFLLYSSIGDADAVQDVAHFQSKAATEAYIKAKLQHWAVVRPCCFFDNLDDRAANNQLKKGKVQFLSRPETTIKWVSLADLGKAAANMLLASSVWEGKTVELAVSAHDGTSLATALSEASGTPCVYKVGLPRWMTRLFLSDTHHMLNFLESGGYSADMEAAKALIGPGAMDAKAWFASRGQWANGEKFATTKH
jgi:uncharacterized protein YbjT (DUF2867 family)